jgi:hypothetical protein
MNIGKQRDLMLRIYCNFIHQASIPRPLELSKKKRSTLTSELRILKGLPPLSFPFFCQQHALVLLPLLRILDLECDAPSSP